MDNDALIERLNTLVHWSDGSTAPANEGQARYLVAARLRGRHTSPAVVIDTDDGFSVQHERGRVDVERLDDGTWTAVVWIAE